jgi:hypothetical protein
MAQAYEHDLDPKNFPGLSEADAAKRLKEEVYNELPSSRQRSIWAIAFRSRSGTDVSSLGGLRHHLSFPG